MTPFINLLCDLGSTGSDKLGKPLTLRSVVNVMDVAEFDENESTITLNILFSVNWNDTRIKVESNTPNE